jgi:anthranilate synthase/aminodeoxychorismate synthase-like glutamine amidotransferase
VTRLRVVLVDNYDSFTWNLWDLFVRAAAVEHLEVAVEVRRPASSSPAVLRRAGFDAAILSPGPNAPADAPWCGELIAAWRAQRPIFGVCLGLQAMAHALGAAVVRAPQPVHGRTALVDHDGSGCLGGLPRPLTVMRYHSLTVDATTLPPSLQVTARLCDAPHLVMALRSESLGLEGVQFHPESVGTPDGLQVARNVLRRWVRGDAARSPSSGLLTAAPAAPTVPV